MRPLSLAVVLLLASAAAPRAETVLRAPVEVDVAGFQAKLDDGRVVLTWRRYKRDDFSWYYVIKSTSEDPQYPDTAPIFSSSSKGDTRYEDGKLSPGTWRYRLCIVTTFGDRWVSPVAAVVIDKKDMKRAAPTEADFE